MLEDGTRERTKASQRQVADALGQLAAGDMARLRQLLDHIVQRGEHEEVDGLAVAGVPLTEFVQYTIVQNDAAHGRKFTRTPADREHMRKRERERERDRERRRFELAPAPAL